MAESIQIPARDGYLLGATLFRAATPRLGAVVINPAMAVPQRLYAAFAGFLASRGFDVVTYDYRGVGRSKPKRLAGFEADVSDWAELDQAGVLDWARGTLGQLTLVGHSLGGQMVGMIEPHPAVARIVTFAAQTGYWRSFPYRRRYSYATAFFVLIPVLSRVAGYFPASKIGLGEDVPSGAARQWAGWCRRPGYFVDTPDVPELHFSKISTPVTVCGFSDDPMAPRHNIDTLAALFPPGIVQRVHLEAADGQSGRIGHFGFFSSGQRDRLWERCLGWL